MTIRVRALGEEEVQEVARMARSRTLRAGLVRRAPPMPVEAALE